MKSNEKQTLYLSVSLIYK